jgi:membrane-associated phospholipid phosphatase
MVAQPDCSISRVSANTELHATWLEPPEEFSAQMPLDRKIGSVTAWLFALTDFGDLAVLMPLAVAMLAWLRLYFSRAAQRWVLALGSCVGLTALLKVVFYECPPLGDMHSPSGHTSHSTLIYGGITLVAATAWSGPRRLLVIGGGAGLILAIGVSRLLLNAHSVAGVGLGLVIGIFSLALFSHQYLQGPIAKVWPLLVAAGVLVSILHGRELHAEQFLQRTTGYVPIHCR